MWWRVRVPGARLDRDLAEPADCRQRRQVVPLAAMATFEYQLEQPVVWRRSRLPTITVKAA
jgi:multidrug efflux pump subunit AcrB